MTDSPRATGREEGQGWLRGRGGARAGRGLQVRPAPPSRLGPGPGAEPHEGAGC
jgi:hypothetical protein